MESELTPSQCDLLVRPANQLTNAQRGALQRVAVLCGRRWMEEQLPALPCEQAPSVGAYEFAWLLEHVWMPTADVLARAHALPSDDFRMSAFRQGVSTEWVRLGGEILRKRENLAEVLSVGVDAVELAGSIGREVLLFAAEEAFFVVFLRDEERVTSAARTLRGQLHRFARTPCVVLANSILPEGSESMISALENAPPEVAHEAIEAVLANPDAFALRMGDLNKEDPALVTGGLVQEGAWYRSGGGSYILRVLEFDMDMLDHASLI